MIELPVTHAACPLLLPVPPATLPLCMTTTLRQVEEAHKNEDLMARAADAAAKWAHILRKPGGAPVLVLAGAGNNGGDAISAATRLQQVGVPVAVVFPWRDPVLPLDADMARQAFVSSGGKLLNSIPPIGDFSLVMDGLFGIGLGRAPEGEAAQLIETANALAVRHRCPLLALDCPSGLVADTGFSYDAAIRATHTLTFIAAKPGLYTGDGPDHCGVIRVAGLGLTLPAAPDGRLVSVAAFSRALRPRPANSHKGDYGSIGILGGAASMQGASLLAGRAALQLGAGKVFLGLLDAPGVDMQQPELMQRPAASLLDMPLAALAAGPGMGQGQEARELLSCLAALKIPLVLDADALNLLAGAPQAWTARRDQGSPVILTPHPAEAARLLGISTSTVQEDRVAAATTLARRFQAWVVLKGCGSIVASPDGAWWINTGGNPGMAGPGFGDVLTGMVTAFLGQGWQAGEALLAAVHLHGRAADDLVRKGMGPVGLTASEIIPAARYRFNRWLAGDFASSSA